MKLLIIVLVAIMYSSCGRINNVGDAALFVVSGGLLPIPCELTSAGCVVEKPKEINTTKEKPLRKYKNQPPLVEFYISDLELNVGDERNVLILISDPEDDNITKVNYFVQDSTLAVLEITKDPYALKVTAKKAGNTNIRVIAKDSKLNEGRTELLPLAVHDNRFGDSSPRVKFSETLIEMDVGSIFTIKYIYSGLSPKYTVGKKITNGLVLAYVNTNTATITIKAKNIAGTDKVVFTFIDSKNEPYDVSVAILVKSNVDNTGAGTVVPPPPQSGTPTSGGGKIRETKNLVFNDPNACSDDLDQISHSYGESKTSTISAKNSISIQSLTNNAVVTLYYKELSHNASSPYGLDISPPSTGLPLGPNSRDAGLTRQFILQASPEFATKSPSRPKNSEYFYLRIQEACYRGVFPANDSESSKRQARLSLKLCVNE